MYWWTIRNVVNIAQSNLLITETDNYSLNGLNNASYIYRIIWKISVTHMYNVHCTISVSKLNFFLRVWNLRNIFTVSLKCTGKTQATVFDSHSPSMYTLSMGISYLYISRFGRLPRRGWFRLGWHRIPSLHLLQLPNPLERRVGLLCRFLEIMEECCLDDFIMRKVLRLSGGNLYLRWVAERRGVPDRLGRVSNRGGVDRRVVG